MTLTLAARVELDAKAARAELRAATEDTRALTTAVGAEATQAKTTTTSTDGLTRATIDLARASDEAAAQTRTHETELRDLAQAEVTAAVAAREAAAAREVGANAMMAQAGAIRGVAQSSGLASSQIANLGYQFNDIGMMLAAGQNPLMLAIQQGTQISQVIGPMGAAGAVKALGGAFMGLLNPTSLITIGAIAAGAAFIQWLTGAGEQVMTLEDRLGSLSDSVGDLQTANTDAAASVSDLTKEYGSAAVAARGLLEAEVGRAQLRAARDVQGAATGLSDTLQTGGWFDFSAQSKSAAFLDLNTSAQNTWATVNGLLDALRAVESATTFAQQRAALEQLRVKFDEAAAASGEVTPDETSFGAAIDAMILDVIRLQAEQEKAGRAQLAGLLEPVRQSIGPMIDRAEDIVQANEILAGLEREAQLRDLINTYGRESWQVARARYDAEQAVFEAMLASLDVSDGLKEAMRAAFNEANKIAVLNISGPIDAAAVAAGRLFGNLNASVGAAGRFLAAWGKVGADYGPTAVFMGPDGQPVVRGKFTDGGMDAAARGVALTRPNPFGTIGPGAAGISLATAGGAGGGGGGAASEADAIAKLIEQQEREIDLLRETDPLRRELLKYREQLAGATDAERAQVEALIAARIREEQQMKAVEAATTFLNQNAYDFLDQLIVQGKTAGEVMANLGRSILQAALQAMVLGKGPLAGILGVKGGLFDFLLPKRAAGGMIYGPGSGTSDDVLMYGSNGEYVVNAAATAKNRGLLEYINAGGALPGYARGGMIGAPGAALSASGAGSASGTMTVNMDLRGARGNKEIEDSAYEGTRRAIAEYDRTILPARVQQISADPRRRAG